MRETTLIIHVISGRNLVAKDWNGTSDPYCIIKHGKKQVKTHVVSKTLDPLWNFETELQISLDVLDEPVTLTIWDKDMFKSHCMGQVVLRIEDCLVSFDKATKMWHPILPRHQKEKVSGDLCLLIGTKGNINPLLKIYKSRQFEHATLIASDDAADELYFNHFVGNEVINESGEMESAEMKASDPNLVEEINTTVDHSQFAGMLLIEIVEARNLPYEKNMLKTSFNCDPFVVVSYGKKTFRTSIIRHSLNPVWKQRIYLHLQYSDIKNDWPVSWMIFDHERFTRNSCICEKTTSIHELVEKCHKPDTNPNGPTSYELADLYIELKAGSDKYNQGADTPVLILKLAYIPYNEMRRNLWYTLLGLYGNSDGFIDQVGLTTVLDLLGSTFSNESINQFWIENNVSFDKELSFEQVFQVTERIIKKTSTEHILYLPKCPICRKVVKQSGDFDMVAHLALCCHEDLRNNVEKLAMGGLTTTTYLTSKWYSKIFSYVTFGGTAIGKNNGHILYQDRATGRLMEEKIPTYIRLGIRLLYQSAGSKSRVESNAIRRLLKTQSYKQGQKFDSPQSVRHISSFIAYHNLDTDEILEPLDSFKSFNEFFYRKLVPGARPICSSDKRIAVCPADARTNCFNTIDSAQQLWIKGKQFTLLSLLQDSTMAQKFQGGSMAVFRLAPQDYHRFHFPVDGIVSPPTHIEGAYFTVNPMAVRTTIDVYTENVRTISYIESPTFGIVAYICIGAMLVGSICLTTTPFQQVQKGDEHGYFKFGGSTVILLFEAGRIKFDDVLIDNSKQQLETLCKMGTSLGIATQ